MVRQDAVRRGGGVTAGGIGGLILARDHKVMRRVHRWRAPRWIRLWMVCATRGGDGWLWYGIGAMILLGGERSRWAAVGAAAAAVGAGIALFLVLKRMAGRKRPCALEAHCWATMTPPDPFSFPSGHSITAFAAAVTWGLFYPALMPALLFCGASVALSRVLLGLHFVSDVVAGSSLGVALGYLAFQLFH
jgi:undecaprenyl-diphosphatase